jgi:hypothetical protein
MESVGSFSAGSTFSLVDAIWVFLARRRFAAKTLGFGGWKSLDFLGFSRANLDFSMGYADKSEKNFFSRFCRRERAVETASPRFGMAKDGLLMAQA